MNEMAKNLRGPARDLQHSEMVLSTGLSGVKYKAFLQAMHAQLEPEWYLEIGTERGRSLAFNDCNLISIDPAFRIESNVIRSRGEAHFFQQTSDDFFDSGRLKNFTDKIDLAFLDGLHWFEYLLRDFMNTEEQCGDDCVVVMHDCIPFTYQGAERDWNRRQVRVWTGDCWKVVSILRKYRADLNIRVVDCPPSGLVVITGLDHTNTVLRDNYDDLMSEYMDLSIRDYGTDKLADDLDIVSSRSIHVTDLVGDVFKTS